VALLGHEDGSVERIERDAGPRPGYQA
jgi:hypothetical protein